jgi:Spy/CpxP family protein refolding chaperone
MRRTLIFLLLLAGVGAGLGFYVEMRNAKALSAQLDEARQKLKFSDEQLAAKTGSIKELEHNISILKSEAEALRTRLKSGEVEIASQAPADGATGSEGGKKPDIMGQMTKMMKDPAFKNMMKPQMEAQMRKMYGDFFKKLNLTPDTEKKFMDLMTEHSLAAMEMGGNIYSGDKEKLNQSADDFKAKQEEHDRQVTELLGADGAAQFKDYQKTLADRMALDGLRGQLSGVNALQQQQSDALLKIMGEERAKSPQLKINDQNDPAGAMKELSKPGVLENYVKHQEELNTRVANRAISVLTPEQYKQFQEFQKQQLEMQKFGMKMAGQFMNPEKSGTGAE